MGLSSKVIEVNCRGSVELIEGALPLLQQRAGTVVVIGSNSMAMPIQDQPLIEALLVEKYEQALTRVEEAEIEPIRRRKQQCASGCGVRPFNGFKAAYA